MKRHRDSFWLSLLVALIYATQGAIAYGTVGPCEAQPGVDDCYDAEMSNPPACCPAIPHIPLDACDCIHEPGKPLQSQLSSEKIQIKNPVAITVSYENIVRPSGPGVSERVPDCERNRAMLCGPPLRVWKQSFQL